MWNKFQQRRRTRWPYSRSMVTGRRLRPKRDLQHLWRYFYLRFVRLRGTPEAIARGAAAGIFAGWFPLIATQMAAAILLAALVRGNKIVAATATWVSNPLTFVPIYAFNFQVGKWLLRSDNESFSIENLHSWQGILELGSDVLTILLVGCFVVGSICAIASYFLCLWLVCRVRRVRGQGKKGERE
jgi:uncharacterized protein